MREQTKLRLVMKLPPSSGKETQCEIAEVSVLCVLAPFAPYYGRITTEVQRAIPDISASIQCFYGQFSFC